MSLANLRASAELDPALLALQTSDVSAMMAHARAIMMFDLTPRGYARGNKKKPTVIL
jgi:hypothetical protein